MLEPKIIKKNGLGIWKLLPRTSTILCLPRVTWLNQRHFPCHADLQIKIELSQWVVSHQEIEICWNLLNDGLSKSDIGSHAEPEWPSGIQRRACCAACGTHGHWFESQALHQQLRIHQQVPRSTRTHAAILKNVKKAKVAQGGESEEPIVSEGISFRGLACPFRKYIFWPLLSDRFWIKWYFHQNQYISGMQFLYKYDPVFAWTYMNRFWKFYVIISGYSYLLWMAPMQGKQIGWNQ